MTDPRLEQAERLLTEAVYRSRARQAVDASLAGDLRLDRPVEPGGCGLGAEAAVVLDLSEEGRAAFERLWPAGAVGDELERIRGVLAGWIELQDRLDRKRNHFLRDFRQANGFDRTRYSAEQVRSFEDGLARIAGEEDAARREAARELLG